MLRGFSNSTIHCWRSRGPFGTPALRHGWLRITRHLFSTMGLLFWPPGGAYAARAGYWPPASRKPPSRLSSSLDQHCLLALLPVGSNSCASLQASFKLPGQFLAGSGQLAESSARGIRLLEDRADYQVGGRLTRCAVSNQAHSLTPSHCARQGLFQVHALAQREFAANSGRGRQIAVAQTVRIQLALNLHGNVP